MFKKPTKKRATDLVKSVVAYEVGKRLSRGLVGLNLSTNPNHARMGITAAALLAAASYTGKNKDIVQAALVGSAIEQGGQIVDDYAQQAIATVPNPDAATKFMYDTLGLKGMHNHNLLNASSSCGCSGLALPAASLVEVDYLDEVEDAHVVSGTFTGI